MTTLPRSLALAAVLACGLAAAQAPATKRTEVIQADLADPTKTGIIHTIEIPAGVSGPRHTHPGDEISYVMEGEVDLLVDGQAPRHLKAGDGFVIPAGTVHQARNTSGAPVRVVVVYVLEKGKPISTPVK